MNEDLRGFMVALGYALIVIAPVFLYAQRGRRTGKISPKKAATMVALAFAFIPLVIFLIDPIPRVPWDIIGFAVALFLFIWAAAYAGPLGMGWAWAGRWNGYVYPERKRKEKNLSPAPENQPVPISERRPQNSWCRLMWEIVLGEMAVLLGVGLIFQKPLMIPLGVGIVLIHLLAFSAIWRWKHRQLEENGWRW